MRDAFPDQRLHPSVNRFAFPTSMSQPITLGRSVSCLLLATGVFYLGRFTAPVAVPLPIPPATGVAASSALRENTAEHSTAAAVPTVAALSAVQIQALRSSLDLMVPSPHRDDELLNMLGAWALVDPLAARAYAAKQLTGDVQAQAFTAVLTSWAKKDATAAWDWVQKNEPNEHSHVRAVLVETARINPALGQRFAASVAEQHPEQAAEVYIYALDGVMHDGNYEAAKLMVADAKMPNEEQKNSLLNFLAGQWARYQPEEAAPWVLALPEGPVRDQAMDGLTQAWSDINPVRAADFAVKLPPGEVRQTALRQAISKWTMDDPVVASKWVLQFDAHQDFDQAVASIATSHDLISRNIGLALGWADTIQNPALRRESTTTVVSNWYALNPVAALNYIKTSPELTTEIRQDLLEKIVPSAPR